jgi:hypothetical protein
MIRKLALAVAVCALILPGAALAAKPKPGLKAGQACTVKKEAMYKAHHFTCVKGKLKATK